MCALQEKSIMSSRNISYDIAKGIGILLMVIGHTGCPNWLHNAIYSFHMPLFFILSGLCLNDQRIEGSTMQYICNKVKRLYIPFVKFGLFFYSISIVLSILFFKESFRPNDVIKDIILILGMIQTPELVACYWFLTALLTSSVAAFIILKVSRIIYPHHLWLNLGILLVIMLIFLKYNIHLSTLITYKTPYYSAFIITGYLLKNNIRNIKSIHCRHIGICCILFCASISALLHIHTDTYSSIEILMVFVLSTIGSLGTIFISKDFAEHNNILSSTIKVLGERTMDILTWHFTGLRMMNILLVLMFSLPTTEMHAFPCITSNSLYWLVYVPFAIFFSLLIGHCIRTYKENSLIKFHR